MSKLPKQWNFINKALEERKDEDRLRTLHPVEPESGGTTVRHNGKTLLNFCSNDYLGLSGHPKLIEGAQTYTDEYGAGATASRLISGTYQIHTHLEEKLARTFGTEAALVFNSGFQANSTILQALTDRKSLILADKRSHNSLIQGGMLSRAAFRRFNHNDLSHLQHLLKRASGQSYNRIVIVTESVFSMGGDRSDLESISQLADRHDAFLFVDEAHAVGVWGKSGLGLGQGNQRIDLRLGTFGKAFGVFGAFVVCSKAIRDYLVNFCPGFIYTTALPPPVIGAIDASVSLLPDIERKRAGYHESIKSLRREIQNAGYNTGPSSTQIIPLIIGEERATIDLSNYLREHGILATAIRPPTVPESGSRIRITISLNHTEEQINHLTDTLRGWNGI